MSKEKTWRIIAIIFMVLFVIESVFLAWAWSYGSESIEKENECMLNVCSGYEAYSYDDWENICYCFVDGEVVKQKYMR